MNGFAGNLLALAAQSGEALVAMSEAAWQALARSKRRRLEQSWQHRHRSYSDDRTARRRKRALHDRRGLPATRGLRTQGDKILAPSRGELPVLELGLKTLIGYLLGSIVGALVIGTFRGVDIRTMGSGNAGGTNALRTQGFAFAAGNCRHRRRQRLARGGLVAWDSRCPAFRRIPQSPATGSPPCCAARPSPATCGRCSSSSEAARAARRWRAR
jgi:hypothetical protein